MSAKADAIVIGGGLAGLVAAAELADAGRHVIVLEQEGENSLGGQAFWSLGGLFFVDSPEQRRMKIRDSRDLALQDWLGSAQFDREEDFWPRRVAEAYVDFAAGEMRPWLHQMGMRGFPVVGWAERGGALAPKDAGRNHVIATGGGPGKATETLVYKVYNDGFVNLILGDSAAQSVILMVIVIGLTAIQFRYVERKVHYG